MFDIFLLLFAIAFISEYAAATLGMGYGTTLAPILLILGYEPLVLVPVILFSQFFIGFIAAGFHHRFENMDLSDKHERSALIIFTFTGIIGVVVSILASFSIPAFYVKIYIALVVMLVGALTLVNGNSETTFSLKKLTLLGSTAGFNKGLSGAGYAPITVGGQILCGIKPRAAVAITALVQGFICAVGVALYYFLAAPVDFLLLIGVSTGGIIAAPMSALTTKRLKQESLKKIVALSIILIGLLSLVIVLLSPS